jgi:hypothetical protein
MRIEEYICDIKNCQNKAEHKQKPIQVIFTTEQTEGRSIEPHLSYEKIDICDKCLHTILKGNYIYASGAMGHNDYVLGRGWDREEVVKFITVELMNEINMIYNGQSVDFDALDKYLKEHL